MFLIKIYSTAQHKTSNIFLFFFRSNFYYFKNQFFTEVITISENNPNRTINDEIQLIIDTTLNQQPKAEIVTIHKVYDDNNYVDVKLNNDAIMEYIPVISNNPKKGNIAILLPVKNDKLIVITK